MSPAYQKLLAFCIASGLSAWTWAHFWPARQGDPASVAIAAAKPEMVKRWSDADIGSALLACSSATTSSGRLEAARQLGKIPLASIPAALEAGPLVKDSRLTLAAKVLLIRWAGSDGDAAANWAWNRFRAEGRWHEAMGEIGPVWAWHDAAGLHRWVMAAKRPGVEVTRAAAGTSDIPMLDASQITAVGRWLAPEEPRLAFELLNTCSGFFSVDPIGAAYDVSQIREALEAFPGLKPLPPGVIGGPEGRAKSLLYRWKELDPEDFARSPYADHLVAGPYEASTAAFNEWLKQPAPDRAAAATRLVDALREQAATENIVPPIPGGLTGIQSVISGIAAKWAEDDPAAVSEWLESIPESERGPAYRSLAGSAARSDLNFALGQADKLQGVERLSGVVVALLTWRQAHPGKQPDTTGWSEPRIAAWEDLELFPEDSDQGG